MGVGSAAREWRGVELLYDSCRTSVGVQCTNRLDSQIPELESSFCVPARAQAALEEKLLLERYGQLYEDYKAKIKKRFFPLVY